MKFQNNSIRAGFEYSNKEGNWLLSLTYANKILVSFCSNQDKREMREYQLEENIVSHKKNSEYVFLYKEDGGFYQFKFEDGAFLVGDIFDATGEHQNECACHIFCED